MIDMVNIETNTKYCVKIRCREKSTNDTVDTERTKYAYFAAAESKNIELLTPIKAYRVVILFYVTQSVLDIKQWTG